MNTRFDSGYVTLLAILIISVVTISSAIGISVVGVDSSRQVTEQTNSFIARNMAVTCAEEALQQIRANTAFTGTNTVTLSGQSCSYTVTNTGGTGRRINTSSTVVNNTRKVTIILVIIGTNISITSWLETTT